MVSLSNLSVRIQLQWYGRLVTFHWPDVGLIEALYGEVAGRSRLLQEFGSGAALSADPCTSSGAVAGEPRLPKPRINRAGLIGYVAPKNSRIRGAGGFALAQLLFRSINEARIVWFARRANGSIGDDSKCDKRRLLQQWSPSKICRAELYLEAVTLAAKNRLAESGEKSVLHFLRNEAKVRATSRARICCGLNCSPKLARLSAAIARPRPLRP